MAPGPVTERMDRLWEGQADLAGADHPVHAIDMVSEEIAPGVLVYLSLASVAAVDTGEGVVLLDTGSQLDVDALYDHVRRWRPRASAPARAAVYSHHHVDHVFGTARFEAESLDAGGPGVTVYGHRDLDANFDRYVRTNGWNRAINVRQFAIAPERFEWPSSFRRPDVTYDSRLDFRLGDCTFELHHARGETDDATWTWVPERGLLHPGDLMIWAVPNAGNPQKVQRWCAEWVVALREMAALGASVMVAGHGVPITGADRVRRALTDTADLLDSLETQTVALMNQGVSLDTVLHSVTVPPSLQTQPWLQPVYDHPQFVVRNIWRAYGGWWDGEPDHLLPAPRAAEAREWMALAGGIGPVLARASTLADGGSASELQLACHLVEMALSAEPTSAEVHALRARVYEARAATERASMAINLFRHAAAASRAGRRDLAERPSS